MFKVNGYVWRRWRRHDAVMPAVSDPTRPWPRRAGCRRVLPVGSTPFRAPWTGSNTTARIAARRPAGGPGAGTRRACHAFPRPAEGARAGPMHGPRCRVRPGAALPVERRGFECPIWIRSSSFHNSLSAIVQWSLVVPTLGLLRRNGFAMDVRAAMNLGSSINAGALPRCREQTLVCPIHNGIS